MACVAKPAIPRHTQTRFGRRLQKGPGYLVSAGSQLASAWGSSDREATPSFGYTRYKCAPTVRCDRNKRSAISVLESPDAAICAIWSSCGDRGWRAAFEGSADLSPEARNSARALSAQGCT